MSEETQRAETVYPEGWSCPSLAEARAAARQLGLPPVPDDGCLGPCCGCGCECRDPRLIGCLPVRNDRKDTETPGWGCATSNIDFHGAIVLLCPECYRLDNPAVYAVAGPMWSRLRLLVRELYLPHGQVVPGRLPHDWLPLRGKKVEL